MKVYSVVNWSNPGKRPRQLSTVTIVAQDENDALNHAKSIGHVTGRERKPIEITDVTDRVKDDEGIEDILKEGNTTSIIGAYNRENNKLQLPDNLDMGTPQGMKDFLGALVDFTPKVSWISADRLRIAFGSQPHIYDAKNP